MTGKTNRTDKFVGWTLTGIRVALGIFWLLQLEWKPPPSFGCPDGGFCFWLDQEIRYPLIPLYADFLKVVVRPNALLVGWLTTLIEISIGLSLVFGMLTRLGGLVGTLWSINLLIGLAVVPNEQPYYYMLMILLNLLFFVIGASGQFSVDQARHWRHWWGRADSSIRGVG